MASSACFSVENQVLRSECIATVHGSSLEIIRLAPAIHPFNTIPTPLAILHVLQQSSWTLNSKWQTSSHIYGIIRDLHVRQRFIDLSLMYCRKLQLVCPWLHISLRLIDSLIGVIYCCTSDWLIDWAEASGAIFFSGPWKYCNCSCWFDMDFGQYFLIFCWLCLGFNHWDRTVWWWHGSFRVGANVGVRSAWNILHRCHDWPPKAGTTARAG